MDSAGASPTLVNFTGTSGADPGTDPEGSLVQGSDGDFDGMTSAGGTSNLGTIFKMTSAGTRTTLVNFTGHQRGQSRQKSLRQPATGQRWLFLRHD